MAWRYIATRLNGNGTETPLAWDVPLQSPRIDEDLSGPGGLTGSISPEVSRLKANGQPLFLPWSTAIYAEADGVIRGGAILSALTVDGPDLGVDCAGFSAYLQGQPYTGDKSYTKTDPLNLARELWANKQANRGGNIGLVLDGDTSPVRVGTVKAKVKQGEKADPEDTGPYLLNWWATHDMGSEFDQLAASTPFDYRVVHSWDGDTIVHRMQLGYPTLGARRTDLRFVLGENIFTEPQITYSGDEYASEVIVLGAGEGREMVRGVSAAVPTRLHRAVVQSDKSITSKVVARKAAEAEARARLGEAGIDQLVALDHPHAPLGSYAVGDEIRVQSGPGWTENLDIWVRILSTSIEPDQGTCTLTVARTEKVT